jgi:hypothetical protein
MKIVEKKLYVIGRRRNGLLVFYTQKEGWSDDKYKAWLFTNKKVDGFALKEFPKGTEVFEVIFVQSIAGPYYLGKSEARHGGA